MTKQKTEQDGRKTKLIGEHGFPKDFSLEGVVRESHLIAGGFSLNGVVEYKLLIKLERDKNKYHLGSCPIRVNIGEKIRLKGPQEKGHRGPNYYTLEILNEEGKVKFNYENCPVRTSHSGSGRKEIFWNSR